MATYICSLTQCVCFALTTLSCTVQAATASPVPVPVPASSRGLAGGAIAGIAIGAGAGLALLLGKCVYMVPVCSAVDSASVYKYMWLAMLCVRRAAQYLQDWLRKSWIGNDKLQPVQQISSTNLFHLYLCEVLLWLPTASFEP